jgi:hypothetical protein
MTRAIIAISDVANMSPKAIEEDPNSVWNIGGKNVTAMMESFRLFSLNTAINFNT